MGDGATATMDQADISLLLVEDDRHLALGLRSMLGRHGFAVSVLDRGDQAAAIGAAAAPRLAVVDVMLPGLDGFAVVRRWRERGLAFPVLMLTARADEGDKVAGLDAGADDYLTKPFGIAELLARLRALLRRSGVGPAPGSDLRRFGVLSLDEACQELRGPAGRFSLSRQELALLRHLHERLSRVCSRQELIDAVWGRQQAVTERVIDYHVVQLRRKLGQASGEAEPRHLLTVHGSGYRLIG